MPMFSQRHFKAVAQLLKDQRNWNLDEPVILPDRELEQIQKIEDAFVRLFKADNPKFKPELFRTASR